MKKTTLISLITLFPLLLFAQTYQVPVSEQDEKMQTGTYSPNWESLKQHQTPEWFRDAKFGIWAHWGPQCVEGSGDWMARKMYIEGDRAYQYHIEHYGHPSEVGFKDILPLFKAEKWDPD
ncbi:MAG: alpha-L-fucosidase, partial [Prevotella sp.]|nr:alpha-L-fucosidase [Prevotella sp.]